MKFEDVLSAFREGKKIRRKFWNIQEYIKMKTNYLWGLIVDEEDCNYSLTAADLTEDDWEIMENE